MIGSKPLPLGQHKVKVELVDVNGNVCPRQPKIGTLHDT